VDTDVTYTYNVTNTGNTPLGTVTLVDDTEPCSTQAPPAYQSGDDGPANGLLDPGETWIYTCVSPAVATSVVNTATVEATPLDPLDGNNPFPDPNPVVRAIDEAAVHTFSADISLVKTADPTLIVLDDQGTPEPVTYTYKVRNNGSANVYLARPGGFPPQDFDEWIVDNTCGPVTYVSGDTNGNHLIDPFDPSGEEWTFTCSTTVSTITVNVASIVAQPSDVNGDPVAGDVSDSDVAVVNVLQPAIIIEKAALSDPVLDEDSTPVFGPDAPTVRPARYTYDVGNIGNVPLQVPAVPVDDRCSSLSYQGGDNNGNSLLDPYEVWTYTCSQPLDRVADADTPPGDVTSIVTNTVSVEGIPFLNGQPVADKPVSSEDSVEVAVIEPGIRITKTASASVVTPGTVVTYTYEVTNTGDVGLEVVPPIDDRCLGVTFQSGDNNGNQLLDGANGANPETWVYTCSRPVYDSNHTGSVVNTVFVGGFDPLGNLFTDSDTAEVRVIDPAIDIEKSVDRTLVPAGTRVVYSFDVTNTGSSAIPLDDALANVITIDQSVPGQPSCATPTYVGGDDNGNGLLDRDSLETWHYTCSAVINEFTVDIALATGEGGTAIDPNNPILVYDRDSAAVEVFTPKINVEKAATPTYLLGPGEVTYTYTVTNDGDVPLSGVAANITDDACAPVTYVSGDDDGDGLLDTPNSIFEDASQETWTFQCTTTLTETTSNTVVAVGKPSDPDGKPLCGPGVPAGRITLPCDVSDDATVLVPVLGPSTIEVEKVAYPADTGTAFDFALSKNGAFTLKSGETKTFTPLLPGNYLLNEDPPAGWALYEIQCTDPSNNTIVSLDLGRSAIALAEGETVHCTYTNIKTSAIVIRKQTSVATSDQFAFHFGSTAFQLGSGGQYVIPDLDPGTYTVGESVGSNWLLGEISCDDRTGGTTTNLATGEATIDLGLAEVVTCTFTNNLNGAILPPTGADSAPIALYATLAVLAGVVALTLSRRRRRI
jgi:uncharacterized repeat protein (TIGR01451 family)